MKENYARKLSIVSIITGCSSLYFYLVRGLIDMNFDNPVLVFMFSIVLIILGTLTIYQIKNNSKNITISVLVLMIIWILLLVVVMVLSFLSNITILIILTGSIFPLYAIYSGVKFFQMSTLERND